MKLVLHCATWAIAPVAGPIHRAGIVARESSARCSGPNVRTGRFPVLHGDIKPANILLDASCNAKLGDFGLARLVDHGTETDSLTVTAQVVAGTPGYMDPEFVNNGRPSAEADVFSFGVVLLELACGRRPTAARPNATATPVLLIDWVRDMGKNTWT